MDILSIAVATLFGFVYLLIFLVLNKKRIRDHSCKLGYHTWQRKKYYCLNCKTGRGGLTVIYGQKKDLNDFKF